MTNQNKYEDWEKGLIKAWGGVLYLGYHILPVNLNNLVDFDRFKNIMVEYFKNSDSDEDMQDWMSDVPPTLDKGKYSLFDKNRIDKVFTEIANKTLTADELIIYRTSDNHMSGWNSYTLRNDNSYTYKNSLTIAYKLPKGFPVIFADGIADNDEVIVKSVEKYIQKQQINEVKRMQQLAGLTTESSAFNDAGEPMMTHNQFRDYSEPSENDKDIFKMISSKLNEDGMPGGIGVGLTLPGGYINGAPTGSKNEIIGEIEKDVNEFITQYFNEDIISEAKFKSPDYIITSVSASAIPSNRIPKADVMLGLKMGGEMGRWTLGKKDYKLDYYNGKVALILSKDGKLSIKVKTEKDPNYLDKIQKFANTYLSDYAKKIKNESTTQYFNEGISESKENSINHFVEYASKKLKLNERPKITLLTGKEYSEAKTSLGGYNPISKEIYVAIEGRLTADILRTIAHEMVHRKQDELGLVKDEIKDGVTGSPIENQAHAVAGILMRNYGKINKQIYNEDINMDVDKGDTVLMGKFKNKKVVLPFGPLRLGATLDLSVPNIT